MPAGRSLDERARLALVGQVDLVHRHRALERRGQLLEAVATARREGDGGARARERRRRGGSDPRRGSGDRDGAAGERLIHAASDRTPRLPGPLSGK
jgi:hypothetical protein